MRLFLFQDIGKDRLEWCRATLEEHIREQVGPPFQTNVQDVSGETWVGYQGVTATDDALFIVNRVIASLVSDTGVRIEFFLTRDAEPEALMSAVESIAFF